MKSRPINIISEEETIELHTGIFSVLLLDGWDVSVNEFELTLKNLHTNKIIKGVVTQLRVQSYELSRKAKKIMFLDVTESGKYLVSFKNQDSLKVWNSSFPFIQRFYKKPLEKQYVQILIK